MRVGKNWRLAAGMTGLTFWGGPTAAGAHELSSTITVVSATPAAPATEPPLPAPAIRRLPDDLGQRRAIRGAPVTTTPLVLGSESPELRALRELDEAPVVAAPPAPSDLPANLQQPDVPVAWQPRVLRYLDFFTKDHRGRVIMSSWLEADGRYHAMMDAALRRAHLPTAIRYVSMIESSFNAFDHTSAAGAMGLWQFLPENARIYGLRVDGFIDERRDPERSTEAFTRYIGDLHARFGSWPLTLAAFNAGYGAVLRAMQKYNTNDYWELCEHEDGLPWETVLYVPKMMAVALVGENRARFGFSDAGAPSFRFDRVNVSTSVSLQEAAAWTGASVAELARLNPVLRRDRTPPDESWSLRVPVGAGEKFSAHYDPRRSEVRSYTLRFGERLDDVARAYGLKLAQLRALNGMAGGALAESDVRGAIVLPAEATRRNASDEVRVVALPDPGVRVAGKKRVFFRPRPDDSVRAIAAFFSVTPTELASWNRLDAGASVAGLVLQIWVAPTFDERTALLVDPHQVRLVTVDSDEFFDVMERRKERVRLRYTAKKADSWAKLATKYGLTVADLERINRVGSHDRPLKAGDHVIVYRAMTDSERRAAHQLDASPLADVRPDVTAVTAPTMVAPAAKVDADPDDDSDAEVVLPAPPPIKPENDEPAAK